MRSPFVHRHVVHPALLPLMLILLSLTLSAGGCFSGDAVYFTAQRAKFVVISTQTNQPLAGVELTGAGQSGYVDQPRPISPNDRTHLDRLAQAQPSRSGTTSGDGTVAIKFPMSSNPGFLGIGKELSDMRGKNWGFRLKSRNALEYLTIFPMQVGTGRSESFLLRVETIDDPKEWDSK